MTQESCVCFNDQGRLRTEGSHCSSPSQTVLATNATSLIRPISGYHRAAAWLSLLEKGTKRAETAPGAPSPARAKPWALRSTRHPCNAHQWPLRHQARAYSCPARDKQNHQAIFQNTGPQLFGLPRRLGTWKVETVVEVTLLPGCPRRHLP